MQSKIQVKILFLWVICPQNAMRIALSFLNSTPVKITIISFSFLIAASSKANWTDLSWPSQSAINYFIEFKPGIYNQPKDNNIEPLLREINRLSEHQINLIGISQSESDLAKNNLALLRAETVKILLVRQGISADRIIVSGEEENFVAPNEIFHGVFVKSSKNTFNPENAINNSPAKNNKVAFIEFPAGVYDEPNLNQLYNTLELLSSLPENPTLKLIGTSQSKTNLATQSLALQRSQVVANHLIEGGIKSSQIKLGTEVTNNIPGNYLTHGVYIFAIYHNAVKTPRKPLDTLLQELKSPAKNSIEIPHNDKIIEHSPAFTLEPTASRNNTQEPCNELNIQKGSLKKNIQREIADCGYQMGQWNFGTNEEYIDWLIPIAYKVHIEKGIIGVLRTIETNYQIRAHVHQLDRSIDFLPSINRDKGQ
jgi:hypothetical protein